LHFVSSYYIYISQSTVQKTQSLQFDPNNESMQYFTEFSDGSVTEFALVTKAEPLNTGKYEAVKCFLLTLRISIIT